MKTDEQKNANNNKLADNGLKYIIYICLYFFIFIPVVKWLMVGILSVFEGGYIDFRDQIHGMCGSAWWGGMNMSNYFFRPTFECDSFQPTFWVGSTIILGISYFLVLQIRNRINGINVGFARNFNIALIYFVVIAIVVTGRYLVGFSPKNCYWGWPDGTILILNNIILVVRGLRGYDTPQTSILHKLENYEEKA